MKKLTLILMLILSTTAMAAETAKGRLPASYSDAEIAKNEAEKYLARLGIKGANVKVKMKAAGAKTIAPTQSSCAFGPNDYWYAYGLDGGCGVNAGTEYGVTSALLKLNQKIACTLNVVPQNCTIVGTLELDGKNGCTGGPIDNTSNLAMSQAKNASNTSSIIPGNVCLTPAQLNTMRQQWTSISMSPYRLIQVMVGGYPGINCMGGWAVTINFGTCIGSPQPHTNPVD